MRAASALARDRTGSTAAEVAMVLPLLVAFLLGIIDVARLMWLMNRAEKATQMGARYAVATALVPSGLASYDFTTSGGLAQGAAIPESAFGGATCSSTACTCKTGATCPPLGTFNSTAFQAIATRMRKFLPTIVNSDVTINYDYSGLGFAGDPNGPDVAPIVTVQLNNVTFRPVTLALFRRSFTIAPLQSSLTLEDGQGNISN